MKNILYNVVKFLSHYSEAITVRLSHFREKIDLEIKGRRFPSHTNRSIWKEPSEIADYIDLNVFFNQDEKITLIDVGGNVGKFTKGFIKHFPNTEAHIFEPVSSTFSVLESEVGNYAKCYQIALSNSTSNTKIWVDSDHTLNSLEEYTDTTNLLYSKEYKNSEVIEIAKLDDFDISLEDKVMLKIDVQGHEVEMLQGATSALKKVDVVLAELTFAPEYTNKSPSFSASCRILEEAGLYPIIFQSYGGRHLSNYGFERDVIFVRDNLLEHIWKSRINLAPYDMLV